MPRDTEKYRLQSTIIGIQIGSIEKRREGHYGTNFNGQAQQRGYGDQDSPGGQTGLGRNGHNWRIQHYAPYDES